MTEIIQEMTADRDKLEMSLGDILDVKAGVLLALIAVVATLTAGLLAYSGIGKISQWCELLSLVTLVVAGVFSCLTLFPRDYVLPDLPEAYNKWQEELRKYYSDPVDVNTEMIKGFESTAFQRINYNHENNKAKSRFLFTSFAFTLVALASNVVTLAILGASKVLS